MDLKLGPSVSVLVVYASLLGLIVYSVVRALRGRLAARYRSSRERLLNSVLRELLRRTFLLGTWANRVGPAADWGGWRGAGPKGPKSLALAGRVCSYPKTVHRPGHRLGGLSFWG